MKSNVKCFGKLCSSEITEIETLLDSSLALYNNDASNYLIDLDEINSQESEPSEIDVVISKLAEIFKVEKSELKDVSWVTYYGN